MSLLLDTGLPYARLACSPRTPVPVAAHDDERADALGEGSAGGWRNGQW